MDPAGYGRHSRIGPGGPLNRHTIVVRTAARRDIERHYRWLAEQAGFDTADRFLDAVDRTFAVLAENPRIGPRFVSTHARLGSLHKWKVDGFPNLLIFYESRSNGISVARVIHAAQDWWSLTGAAE
ncbi:type II toxin-antitoxin system RelE/ParE family toxin [Sphingomonas sp. HMWF008]|nr:type II toxin-antitoxin system RelE/ParE family toxin [Sphingomonas sp. HMWF008]